MTRRARRWLVCLGLVAALPFGLAATEPSLRAKVRARWHAYRLDSSDRETRRAARSALLAIGRPAIHPWLPTVIAQEVQELDGGAVFLGQIQTVDEFTFRGETQARVTFTIARVLREDPKFPVSGGSFIWSSSSSEGALVRDRPVLVIVQRTPAHEFMLSRRPHRRWFDVRRVLDLPDDVRDEVIAAFGREKAS